MRRFFIKPLIAVFISVVMASCAGGAFREDPHLQHPIQVGIYAGGTQTRTEMGDNGLSTHWTADD
jgi:hypothetical protein